MQKLSTKIISILTIFMLVGALILPTLSYASTEIQEAKTTEENVSLNASINGSRDVKLNVKEGGNLELGLKVDNTGYLNDIKVTLDGNNYELNIPDEKNENLAKVKKVEGNIIELNEINADEEANIILPIKFIEGKEKTAEDFNKKSKVVFNAVYKNAQGKERKIKKEIELNLEWKVETNAKISQNLTRYLKYGNNTMISVEIEDGIEENLIPVVNKEISIKTPTINNKVPNRVIVNAENVESNYEAGKLTITKEVSANEEGKISVDSFDKYDVTYIYETQSNENQINTFAEETLYTIKGDTLKAETNDMFDVTQETGSIVSEQTETVSKINKGFMYTNTLKEDKQATVYQEKYNIDVGLSELVDSIKLEQTSSILRADDNQIADITPNIITKKITAENLIDILGEEGNIKISALDGSELGNINKDNTEIDISNSQIIIETTKPKAEGTLKLLLVKEIGTDAELNLDQLKAANILSEKIVLTGYKSNTEMSREENSTNITLEAPISKASLTVSQNTLSTVVENKDIVFNVVLNKSKIEDALYKNPRITITLPEEVTEINVTDARVLYEDEIKTGTIDVDKNTLTVNLEGMQTQYLADSVSEGTLVRIVANVSLYNLAPSSDAPISLTYSNEFTGEENTLMGNISVVAPTGFVTTNTIEVDGKSETALESDKKEIEIDASSAGKEATISGIIVNNLGEDATNAIIIGRIPFKGNKTLSGVDLESNIDLSLASEVTVEGQEKYKVYYSDDGEADINSNKWSESASVNTKSFKIIFDNPIATSTLARFKYNVSIPENLVLGVVAKTSYGVYYNNNAVEGIKTNLVQSKAVGIATPGMPNINAEVETVDTNDGHVINNEGNVTEGEYITYRVKVSNNGTKEAKNINVEANIPDRIFMVEYNEGTDVSPMAYYSLTTKKEKKVQVISNLKPDETKYVEFNTKMPSLINIDEVEEPNTYKSTFNITSENESSVTTLESTLKNTQGDITLKLSSNIEGTIQKDTNATYLIRVQNSTENEKKNIILKVDLPDGLEYIGNIQNADYNRDKNELTLNIDSIEGNLSVREIAVKTKCIADIQRELPVTVTAISNGNEIKSNTVTLNSTVIDNKVTATQKSSIKSGNMLDTDTVEFYIDIANNSNTMQTVIVNDTIPSELTVLSYKATVEGNIVENGTGYNSISSCLNIESGQTGRITITAKGNSINSNEKKEIENKPEIEISQGNSIQVNSTNLTIKGTREDATINETNTANTQSEGRTFNIQGTIWYDENSDGKRDETEKKLSGIKVTLYNAKEKQILKDSNGKNMEITTDQEGNYEFYNIPKGKYNVIAYYDKESYDVGTYQAQNISDAENSDFVESKLDGQEVAVTNTLEINESNIYNVDLALSNKNVFDLSLDNIISKVTVTNSKTNNTKKYEFNSNLAKFELEGKELRDKEAFNSNTALIEYKITVKNNGHVAGYAKSIVDYVPKGLEFSSELNKDWYIGKDGYAHNTNLANTIINPGETLDCTLVLTKKITEDNIGTVRNTAEIESSYNEQGLVDINSSSNNMQTGENDMSSSDLVIATSAGRQMLQVTGITIGLIALITIAVYEIKKQVINKVEII